MEKIRSQPRRALYTVLIGEYEKLNELEVSDSSVHAICFTDDPQLVSSTWDIVLIESTFPGDQIRSQRLIKIQGHPVLDQYDEWLYIDNTVRLLKPPSYILDEFLKDCDLAIPTHSYREDVLAAFTVVKDHGLDSRERLEEQRLHYEEFSPSPLHERPLWTGIIARRPTSSVRKWSDSWAQHVLRYSRRDQLSVLTVLEIHKPNFKRVEIDTFSSDFHQWPIHNERKREKRFYSGTDLVQESEKLQKEILQLNNELRVVRDAYANSTSWKITRPLRAISLALKAIRGFNKLETMNSDG